ncbi:hypothetical protein RsoM2USA_155 [Ralstonia phage RsoM2USA]|nr:hypothetical protein RsoM2USA_155 [Ralstonia phage RsoM2USA]
MLSNSIVTLTRTTMKIVQYLMLAVMVTILTACGGGGSASPQSVSVSNPSVPPSTPTPKGWVETDSTQLAYNGTYFGRAVIGNADGSTTLAFGGPEYANIAGTWTCNPTEFKAVKISGDGKLSDDSTRLNPGHMKAIHSAKAIVADFNGDGVDDVYFGNSGCDNPNIAGYGKGEHSTLFISSPNGYVDGSAALPPLTGVVHSLASADITKSGKKSLIIGILGAQITNPDPGAPYDNGPNTSFGAIGPYVLKSNGNGTFQYQNDKLDARISNYMNAVGDATPSKFTDVALADMNGDGYPDLIVGADQSSQAAGAVYLNDGAGGFQTTPIILPTGSFGSKNTITLGIKVMDVDGDGKPDLILEQTSQAPYYTQSRLQVLKNAGSSFTDITSSVIPNQHTNNSWAQYLHLVDLNGDGKLDLLLEASDAKSDDVIAYSFNGNTFEPMTSNLPATQVSLTPVKNRLVSVQANPDTGLTTIKVYQYFP